jgi:hypothetical protein
MYKDTFGHIYEVLQSDNIYVTVNFYNTENDSHAYKIKLNAGDFYKDIALGHLAEIK